MSESCADCKYSTYIVKEGEKYEFTNAFGDSSTRVHQQSVLLCRAMPPIIGQWPTVLETDWCGYFEE